MVRPLSADVGLSGMIEDDEIQRLVASSEDLDDARYTQVLIDVTHWSEVDR